MPQNNRPVPAWEASLQSINYVSTLIHKIYTIHCNQPNNFVTVSKIYYLFVTTYDGVCRGEHSCRGSERVVNKILNMYIYISDLLNILMFITQSLLQDQILRPVNMINQHDEQKDRDDNFRF